MKIITFYLPQFHSIPENDQWWGKGFTEWTNVKKAKPLFDGHNQPRVPLNENYYNLSNASVISQQASLAKQYGVYGWCIYHYWFSGHKLLEKPTELLLEHQDIDMPFCICWANESWTNGWVSKSNKILIKQENGDVSDWINHFNYLLPFFKDKRYITIDGMPLFVVYRPELFPNIDRMIVLWNELAIKNGINGICFCYQTVQNSLKTENSFSYRIEYQPNYAVYDLNHNKHKILKRIKHSLSNILLKIHINIEYVRGGGIIKMDYDKIWAAVLKRKPEDKKSIPGAFVDWDNTPRRGNRGSLMCGFSTDKFEKYLKIQVERARTIYQKDMLFLFAWNEWAEGGYLEPDEKDKYGRLNAIKNAIK